MITARGYAKLAQDAYEKHSKEDEFDLDGKPYAIVDIYVNPVTGYSGTAYRNNNTREIVIAHRGTQTNWGAAQDGVIDLGMVVAGYNAQLVDARRFTARVVKAAREVIGPEQDPFTITTTGHSLGGTLAQAMAHEYGLYGETFNAYGAVDLQHGIPEGGSQVVNHVRATDIVAAASRHFGSVNVLATQRDVDWLRVNGYDEHTTPASPRSPLTASRLSAHSIDNFAPKRPDLTPSDLLPENEARARAHRHAIGLYREDVRALRTHTLSAPWKIEHKVETAKTLAALGTIAAMHGDKATVDRVVELARQRADDNIGHAVDTASHTAQLGLEAIGRVGSYVGDELRQGAEDVRHGLQRAGQDLVRSLEIIGEAVQDGNAYVSRGLSQAVDSVREKFDRQPRRLDAPEHPGHALYCQAREGVHRLDAQYQRTPDQRSDQLAAALAVAARREGLARIDEVVLGETPDHVFARQKGTHSVFDRYARVHTVEALDTPLAQSSSDWARIVQGLDGPPCPEVSPLRQEQMAEAGPAR